MSTSDKSDDETKKLLRSLLQQAEAAGLTAAARYFRDYPEHFQDAARMAREDVLPEASIFVYTMQ
jgi:hypothetical protein